MEITASLNEKIAHAVRASMQIEGYQPTQSPAIKAQAKALMEQHGIRVSTQQATACRNDDRGEA